MVERSHFHMWGEKGRCRGLPFGHVAPVEPRAVFHVWHDFQLSRDKRLQSPVDLWDKWASRCSRLDHQKLWQSVLWNDLVSVDLENPRCSRFLEVSAKWFFLYHSPVSLTESQGYGVRDKTFGGGWQLQCIPSEKPKMFVRPSAYFLSSANRTELKLFVLWQNGS